jgi:poly(3-hydroxybutyrate) depolymerase
MTYRLRVALLPLLALALMAGTTACAPRAAAGVAEAAPGANGVRDGGVPATSPPPIVPGEIQSRRYFFPEAGAEMPYELYVPRSYRADRPMPLIVALHGLGSTPSQVIRYQGLTALAEERGYIVVAPMGYNTRGWYGSMGPGRPGGPLAAPGDPDNLGELSERDVLNVLARVRRELNVDSSRVFLFGHSMGGGGALHLGMTHPHLWAGLAPVAPAIYTSPDGLRAMRHIPVIIIHGDQDRLVSVQIGRRWAAMMQELEMTHRYMEIAGGDHTAIIARSPANMGEIFNFFDAAGR